MATPSSLHSLHSDTPTPPSHTEPHAPVNDVIFDFGGVLIHIDYRACLEGHCPPEVLDRLGTEHNAYGFYEYEDRMDAGELIADVLKDYRAEFGAEMAEVFRYYVEHYDDAMAGMVYGMEQLVRDLKAAGYGVWGLTNWSSETFHYVHEKFPQIEELLDGTVVSGVEHMHKPNADIFELALSRYGLTAGGTAFLDDNANNVGAASALGIHARLFTSQPQARTALHDMGLEF